MFKFSEDYFCVIIYNSGFVSQALGQSYDCPSASEITLKDMGPLTYQNTAIHNKA